MPPKTVQQQALGPNNVRYPTPAGNTLPGGGMMSPSPSNQGGMLQSNVGGGMPPFPDPPDVKPRIPPRKNVSRLLT